MSQYMNNYKPVFAHVQLGFISRSMIYVYIIYVTNVLVWPKNLSN